MSKQIAYPNNWPVKDKQLLEGLFVTARRQGLWFFHQGLAGIFWFSPEELEAEQLKGNFIWGPANWTLRNPLDRLDEYRRQEEALMAERNAFIKRVTGVPGGRR